MTQCRLSMKGPESPWFWPVVISAQFSLLSLSFSFKKKKKYILLIYFLAMLRGMLDLSSSTRDWPMFPAGEATLDHQGSPILCPSWEDIVGTFDWTPTVLWFPQGWSYEDAQHPSPGSQLRTQEFYFLFPDAYGRVAMLLPTPIVDNGLAFQQEK